MNIKKLFIDPNNLEAARSSGDTFVHLLKLPSVILDPIEDRFLAMNTAFEGLWKGAEIPLKPSVCFESDSKRLSVFTEAVIDLGAASTGDLEIRIDNSESLPCLVQGTLIGKEPFTKVFFLLVPNRVIESFTQEQLADRSVREGLLEWKRLESLYKQAESLNELILTAAGDGIFGVDQLGRTQFVNPAASKTLGWREEDLIGKSMHEQIHHHHESGELYPAETCPIHKTLRNGRNHRVENEVFWHKSGKPIPVEYNSTPIYIDGKQQGSVIIFRDITERLRTQAKLEDALRKVDSYKKRLEHENAYLRNEIRMAGNHAQIIGDSAPTIRLLDQIQIVAPTDASVLVTGESGTGKELVAQAIHDASDRRDQPLIKVNCAAVPKELFESEFFGHLKGSFTGATSDRVGRFELANGGTLFLDEVGEIPLDLQSKLLRVIQDRRYERLGEGTSRTTDVRIIVATNRDLEEEVKQGRFREDLYFRLNVFPIHCSPLRERISDIPDLAKHFVGLVCRRSNLSPPIISDDTIRKMQRYRWPGNARELQNVIERGTILAQGGNFTFEHSSDPHPRVTANIETGAKNLGKPETLADIAELEKVLILETIERHSGRISGPHGAAKTLGINPQTLYSKLRKFKLKAADKH